MINLLLDTHALLWWFTDDPKLSKRARRLIGDEANRVFFSAASAWEIATKLRLGRLDELPDLREKLAELVTANGFEHLPMTYLHGLRAGAYDVTHRDPFDRMLAAQSELEGLTLVTRDPAFGQFSARTAW